MDNFLAQILAYGFNFPPKGWALCNGQTLAINTNQALFSLLGTTYGGNGIQTFQLPDLRGRIPVSFGQGPGLSNYALGQVGGTQSVTLQANQLPLHTHTLNANNGPSTVQNPGGSVLAQGPLVSGTNLNFYSTSANAVMAPTALANNGSGQAFPVLQPYNVLSFCIALTGIFPSRN